MGEHIVGRKDDQEEKQIGYKRVAITSYGGPEVLKIEDVAALPEPKAKVRVKVLAAGAVFTDAKIRKGIYPDVKELPFHRATIWLA